MHNQNGTATLAPTDEFKPQTHYSLEGEYMVRTTYKTIKDEIVPVRSTIPFCGQIAQKLTVHHEGGQKEVILTIAGKIGGQAFRADISAEEFINPQKLYLVLVNHMPGKPPSLEPHLKKFIEPAISAITNEREMERINAVPHTGWTPDGNAFVMPATSVGQGNYICKLGEVEAELKHFQLAKVPQADFEQAFLHLMGLRSIYRPGTIYTLIAHAFIPPLIRWVGNRVRYMYHLHGETGAKKTELAKLIMGLYGPTNEDAITYKWTDTPAGAEQRAYALKDCLMLIDDLKPGTINQNQRWVAFIQAAVDAMGRKRAQISGRAREALPPRALLLSTGETVPNAGEESYTARMLQARLDYQPGGWNSDLARIQDNAHLLSGLMYEYIDWLIKGEGQGAANTYHELQQDAPEVKHARLRNNYVANRLGAKMFARFCQDKGLMSQAETEFFLRNHQDSLLEIIRETSAVAHSQRYSQRFVTALREAIETGQVFLAGDPDAKPSAVSNYIGWEDDDFVYLVSGGMKLVIIFAQRTGLDINIDIATLRRQLHTDGLTYSSPGRVKAGKYDYQPFMGSKLVTAFYKNKLWPTPENEHDLHDKHDMTPNHVNHANPGSKKTGHKILQKAIELPA